MYIKYPATRTGAYKIPEFVTEICEEAFSGCRSLTSVTIPEGVTKIGDCAFSGCSSLTSVTIPESVKWIGYKAFSGCRSLTSVTIPKAVRVIGREVFSNCDSIAAFHVAEENVAYCDIDGILYTKDKRCMIACPAARTGAFDIPVGTTSIEPNLF